MGTDMHIWRIQHFNKKRQHNNQTVFSAAAQKAAALFVSTFFYLYSHHSSKYSFKRTPGAKQVCAFFLSRHQERQSDAHLSGNMPSCRSPPSDFDFASQLKNRNWRNYP